MPQSFDVAIVLGHSFVPGIGLTHRQCKRLDKAVVLYHQGIVSHIITTGGFGRFNRTNMSLAKHCKRYLINHGVNTADIIAEGKSIDTRQNALFSLRIMLDRNYKSAIIITSFPHVLRARRYFADTFPSKIRLGYTVSDSVAGLATFYDWVWEIAGWAKYVLRRLKLIK